MPKKTPFADGVAKEARALVSADYGVWMYPTTILIDKSGIVVGMFDSADANDVAKLKKLLDRD